MKLIFIHGSGGCRESWRYQVQRFPDGDAIDLPGHPEGELRDSVEGYAEWLKGYVDQRGYGAICLVGHSLGTAVAQTYALAYPQAVKGLVLVGGGARLRVHPMYLEMLEQATQDASILEEFFAQSYATLDPELTEVLKRRAYENGAAAFLNDMRCCNKFDIMERVGELTVPTLALCGSEDVMTPPKYTHYLAEHIPGARAVVIEGGTHMVFAEKPDEVNQAIAAFVAQL